MNAEKLLAGLYEAKTLASLYTSYSKFSPKSEAELRSAQKEMKAMKESMLKRFREVRNEIRRMESEVRPE